jgi:energy-coupling factor transport system ATP-binding protein
LNAIALHEASFTYAGAEPPALRSVSLEVPAGQICAVVGRAGAGKSSLCALCAGFIPNFYKGQFSGSASVDGQDVVERPVAELVRHVGLVSSNPFSQISGASFTVFAEVGFGLENLGVPRDEIIERVEWALRVMELDELRERSPYQLSGGQQQRMVIAATLAMRPPVLVLDEPTAQLDPPTTAHLAGLLRELSRQGTTILLAEHRLEWVAELAERVVALDAGALIADGPAREVLTNLLLLDHAIGWPRPALLAARARDRGHWPSARPLPVTLDGLVEGLRDNREPRTENREPKVEDGGWRMEDGGWRADKGAERELARVSPSPPLPRSPSSHPVVALEDVNFTYPGGVEVLRGVTLAVGAGERLALLGRNGAGKSTLVRHLNGLLLPTSGRVLVAGTDTRTTTVARCARHVGIVFQDIRNQLFARTVRDELSFGPRNLGYSLAEVDALVERSLDALGLAGLADEHPYDLPTPLRRLVAVAAVMAMDTELLVLDEPTAGLDSAGVARLAAVTRTLAAHGKSVIVISHDLDFCFEALDRVILLRDGGIALDRSWGALDDGALATLESTIGLPLALHTASALDLPRSSPLAALLAARD